MELSPSLAHSDSLTSDSACGSQVSPPSISDTSTPSNQDLFGLEVSTPPGQRIESVTLEDIFAYYEEQPSPNNDPTTPTSEETDCDYSSFSGFSDTVEPTTPALDPLAIITDQHTAPRAIGGNHDLEKIPLLDNSEQWLEWSRDMREKLGINGFLQMLPGGLQEEVPTQRDGEGDETFLTRRDKWFDKRDMACAAIRSRLSRNAYQRVQPTSAKPLDTPALIWNELHKNYKPKGKALFVQFYRKWEETTLESTGSVSQFAATLRQIQADMTALDPASAWPHSHVIRKFINGLSPEFDSFLTTWEISASEIPEYDSINPAKKQQTQQFDSNRVKRNEQHKVLS
ncbi:hypothetical protein RRF57_008709 [Xylaria bambusicola]|uniref:Uncharacterized protein n=1 Tax=Xylaria bambusicola TaxID=326684 RepID=A0AAN7UIC2_9PEZI